MGATPSQRWQPAVTGELARRASAVVDEIAAQLIALEPLDATLSAGGPGLAVFFAHLAEVSGDDAHASASRRLLDHATEALRSQRMDPSLYAGFTGIAWAVDHVTSMTDGPDRLARIDDALLRLTSRSPWRRDYDLISGLVGIGTYAAGRLPRPVAYDLLSAVVARLDELAVRDATGASLLTDLSHHPPDVRAVHPPRFVDLGMAHGLPGVVALLAIAHEAGIDRARPLLDEVVAWTLDKRLDEKGARYPRWTADGEDPAPARTAWCYGDPGVAAALHVAARCVNEPAWDAEAIATAHQVAQRTFVDTRVVDTSLCHGAAGLTQIFNRMHQDTADKVLAELARSWVAITLDLYEPLSDHGLLTGAAGVGLALLAAAGASEPTWDRLFLLSAPELSRSRQT